MEENIPINKSVFSEQFDGNDSQGIFLLAKDNSLILWRKFIDEQASSYFNLPDDNWLIRSNQIIIGSWISYFSDTTNREIEKSLSSSIPWRDDDIVYFCISKYLTIESTWIIFKNSWRSFLECEDDCPIIINKFDSSNVIIFYPLGNVVNVKAD